jgi:hypothetical protein
VVAPLALVVMVSGWTVSDARGTYALSGMSTCPCHAEPFDLPAIRAICPGQRHWYPEPSRWPRRRSNPGGRCRGNC